MRKLLLSCLLLSSISASAQTTISAYKDSVDARITNKTGTNSITKQAVGGSMKDLANLLQLEKDSSMNFTDTASGLIVTAKRLNDSTVVIRTLITAAANQSRLRVGELTSRITADSSGCIAAGITTVGDTGSIKATNIGAVALGFAVDSSQIISSGGGSMARGKAITSVPGSSAQRRGVIKASASGATAMGYAAAGNIEANSTGAFAHGATYVSNNTAGQILADGTNWGNEASGMAYGGLINATKYGSKASGYSYFSTPFTIRSTIRATGIGSLVHGVIFGGGTMEATLNGGFCFGSAESDGQMLNNGGAGGIMGIANKGIMQIPATNYTPGRGTAHGAFVLGHCWWYGSYMSAAGDGCLAGGDQNTNWNRDVNLISYYNTNGQYVGDTNYNGGSSSMQWGANLVNTGDYSFLFGHTLRNNSFKQFKVGWANDMIHADGLKFVVRLADKVRIGRGDSIVVDSMGSLARGYVEDPFGSIKATNHGAEAVGFAKDSSRIESTGNGSYAGGYGLGNGTLIKSSNNGSFAYGAAYPNAASGWVAPLLQASGHTSMVQGFAGGNSTLEASGSNTQASGVAFSSNAYNRAIVSASGYTAYVHGYANVHTLGSGQSVVSATGQASHAEGAALYFGSIVTATGNGSRAQGWTQYKAKISSTGTGAVAEGYASGNLVADSAYHAPNAYTEITSSQLGSYAGGFARFASRILSTGFGSRAFGFSSDANSLIYSGGSGSLAGGVATAGDSVYTIGDGSLLYGRNLYNTGAYSYLFGRAIRNTLADQYVVGWDGVEALRLTAGQAAFKGNVVTEGYIQTGRPNGNQTPPGRLKFGSTIESGGTTYLEVEVNGVTKYLALVNLP